MSRKFLTPAVAGPSARMFSRPIAPIVLIHAGACVFAIASVGAGLPIMEGLRSTRLNSEMPEMQVVTPVRVEAPMAKTLSEPSSATKSVKVWHSEPKDELRRRPIDGGFEWQSDALQMNAQMGR